MPMQHWNCIILSYSNIVVNIIAVSCVYIHFMAHSMQLLNDNTTYLTVNANYPFTTAFTWLYGNQMHHFKWYNLHEHSNMWYPHYITHMVVSVIASARLWVSSTSHKNCRFLSGITLLHYRTDPRIWYLTT